MRIEPVQTVTVTRAVAAAPDTVAARIAKGPVPREPRPLLLRLGIPLPATVSGISLTPGARWTFCYHGDAHGDGGQITAEVAESAPGRVAFRVVGDTTITARWLALQHADLTWHPGTGGGTEVTMSMTFRRGLDPVWYFGPVENAFVTAAAEHLLDTLDVS
ncbi:hypothetical protein F4553_000376 [Allocatelliglobosispora scoriae]|uniref:SRPBCC family protein n=1 Tax=Allocatelliglobosispora scoriae TaxID=643052 RepID=A0A841BD14_9ACTN|nr:SRPBCC family protein [Allocatelliglobosispora scoriae]MBB5866997.1 hypothetical protein [Allocatelliglobosispora scoriae]